MPRHPSPAPPRTSQCYHCWRAVTAAALARTITCPHCYQRLQLDDVVIEADYSVSKVQTCGRLVIGPRARVTAKVVHASAGIELHGQLRAGEASSAGRVAMGPGAQWTGDCRAAELVVHRGAVIHSGLFTITPSPEPPALSRPQPPAASPARAGRASPYLSATA